MVELNARDNEALIRAALHGDVATIQTWLEDIAWGPFIVDVNHRRCKVAADNARAEMVRVLIYNGADIDFIQKASWRHSILSPLLLGYAVPGIDPTETAKVLIEALGAELFTGDVECCTRFIFAATRYPSILRALLRAGIRVDGRDEDGNDVEAFVREEIVLSLQHYSDVPVLRESARILEGTRLAGSYKRFFLAPHHGMLALRKLVLCGRAEARASPSTSGLDYYQKVFNFYTTEGTGDEGCDDNFVARSLAMDLDQVKDIIEFLSSKGDLYSTIDDDHHKSIHDYLLPPPYPPAVPAVAPSFLLPDPVFFLILQFWLGAY